MRRSPKRPVHAVKAARPKITRKQWVAIGKAYQRPIRMPVRQAILDGVREYAALEHAESGGVRIKAADKYLVEIREHAKALLAALTAEGDAALFTHDLLEQASVDLDRLRGSLIVLEHVYPAPDLRPHKKGEAWAAWVRGLTVICKVHDLPTEVRQDLDRQRRSSPFVVFVEKLQEALPPHLQRHTHSRGALTSAISATRMRTE
jgi:hypothetical protein